MLMSLKNWMKVFGYIILGGIQQCIMNGRRFTKRYVAVLAAGWRRRGAMW